ncbi:MAG: TauD/TfdA family dioxygenase, partial [Acidimicrobiales bacterium]|nr:TauD/TfdA family dioxygenase [Acidimicrobiales bacterium]
MSWRAADLAADRSWHLEWDHRELSALDAWASVTSGEDPDELVAALAGAPEILVERAEAVRSELINGYGLVLLSGLDVGKYDRKSIAVMFMLFGSLIGSLRSQNAAGHLLGHVTDVGADVDDPATRIYQTNQRQTFHTDSTDAVGLLCLRTAKEGGVSMVVSVDAVHERLAEEAPELAARLFEPIATDRRNEQPDGELPWFEIPVLSPSSDGVTGIYQRQYIDSAQRFEDAPRPDKETLLALDAFDAIMNDPTMRFQMDLAPGDMQFVHNHSLLHDRTG